MRRKTDAVRTCPSAGRRFGAYDYDIHERDEAVVFFSWLIGNIHVMPV
jgi:hypothetical protein